MSEKRHERPGVYSAYDAAAVISAAKGSKAIGVAAKAARGTAGETVTVTSYAAGVAAFGEDTDPGMSTLLRRQGGGCPRGGHRHSGRLSEGL